MIPKPVQRARRLIKKYGYESPDEIDLIDLLYKEGLYLKYEPSDSYQGKIVFNKHAGIITLNLNLENENQKRYVIAHEMGHFFNERALTRSLPKGEKVKGEEKVEVKHEFKRDRYHDFIDTNTKSIEDLIHEKEANQFAVELLMARRWVVEAVSGKLLGVSLLKEVAEKFRVSLTAAALRYAELYKDAMAVILSKDKRIEWMTCNKNFAFGKLKKYEPVPLNTRTYDIYDLLMPTNYIKNQRIKKYGFRQFMKEKADYSDSLDETVTVDSADWFGNDNNAENDYLRQIDFPMVNYNSILTILWL